MKPLLLVLTASLAVAGLIAAQKVAPSKAAAVSPTPATPAPAASPAPVIKTPAVPQVAPPPAATPAPAPVKNSTLVSSDISGRELLFLTSAIEHGRVQLYLGELAKTRASTEQVKAMGEVLSSTQADENGKIARLAKMNGITISDGEPAAQKALAKKFEKLTGPKFDKTLMEEIVAANQRALSNYEAAQQTKDPEIKAFVSVGLPMAKEKLLLANKMSGTSVRSDKVPGFRTRTAPPAAQ